MTIFHQTIIIIYIYVTEKPSDITPANIIIIIIIIIIALQLVAEGLLQSVTA